MVRINSWFALLIVTSLTYNVTVSLQCPTSADEWERASLALQCKLPNSYHCLKDEKDVITEQCLAKVWIEGGMCPVYSSRMSKIDVIECSTPSCPQSTYWSNSVFLYPVCFETSETLPTTTLRSTIIEQVLTTGYSPPFIYDPKTKTGGNKTFIGGATSMKDSGEGPEHGNTMIYIIVGICAALALILGITLLVVVRRTKKCKSHNHEMRKEDLDNTDDTKLVNDENNKNASTEKSSLMSTKCPEESRKSQLGDTKDENNKNASTEKSSLMSTKCPEESNENNINASTEKSILMSTKCPEESSKSQLEDTKGTGISEEGIKSSTCEVYVASGPNLPRKAEQSDTPQVLMLVRKNPLEKKQIDEHAEKVFGRKYVFCWTMSHYQQHKQEEQASVLLKDFDFKTASVEEILKKLLAVVAAVETRVAFVVAVPLETWRLNREDISQVEDGDKMLICKTVFVK